MENLPVEILNKIIDFLTPREKVQLQSVCKKLFSLGRDNAPWKIHCYEQSWAAIQASRPSGRISESLTHPTATLNILGQNSLRDLIQPVAPQAGDNGFDKLRGLAPCDLARAAADWDSSIEGEHVDWYSEYIARHGPVSLSWVQHPTIQDGESRERIPNDVKGMGLLRDWTATRQNKIVAPLEDGSVCIWDLNHSHSADSQLTRGRIAGISEPSILLANHSRRDHCEGVNVDSFQRRAYLAVGNVLNEVDLETLRVISQQRYPWTVWTMSQETDYSVPLTLATTVSLHIYDSRLSAVEEDEAISLRCEDSVSKIPELGIFTYPDSPQIRLQSNGLPPHRIRSPGPSENENYAPLFQPGPLSILHPPAPHVNTIILAGRFPSILCYDRRFFPRLESTVHSGGRLCGLASAPGPQFPFSDSTYPTTHSVVACGEYNGRGSLELYSLDSSSKDSQSDPLEGTSTLVPAYNNRQSAASSKLLSVASHGNRLVYSDLDGNIKWAERNGRSEVRRWNINSYDSPRPFPRPGEPSTIGSFGGQTSQSNQGSEVARKILPTGGNLTGDELLIWTGERIGRVKFSISASCETGIEEEEDDWFMHAEVDEETREAMRHKQRDDWEKEQRYIETMRRALARQADEVRWMGTY
ncbi:hypothetical protein N7495_003559 [Penicillium taxi]|uniref:uncharacterized protein n=1 Tax=Penicillium taxi TaxID=168475 RepID=UPI002544EDD6|nr:uncharacterized protein N7495_003559 [Penicillium taxi]KAJ5898815.1 hypothetical protein N7495_003559 [Penicillium taxi]